MMSDVNVVFASKGPVGGLWFFMAIEESTHHGRVHTAVVTEVWSTDML